MERERTRLREKMNATEKNMAKKAPVKVKKTVNPKELRVGDSVKVLSLNLKGTVSTLPDAKGNLFRTDGYPPVPGQPAWIWNALTNR